MHAQTLTSASTYSNRVPTPQSERTEDGIEELQPALGPRRWFSRGQYLFRSGEPCTGIYLVQEGCVKVSTLSLSGDEQIVRFCLPGELLGIEAVSEPRHSSSAVALEATRVRPLPVATLHTLCQRSPDATRHLLRLISRRIADLQEHMLLLGRKTAPERLAGFLTDLRRRTLKQELQLGMSREAIGSYLGIALETVSRLLHQFEDEKLIRVNGRRVSLLKPDRLRELAEGTWVH